MRGILTEMFDCFSTHCAAGYGFIAEVNDLFLWLLTSYLLTSRLAFGMSGVQRKD